jgi:hypothetical protein
MAQTRARLLAVAGVALVATLAVTTGADAQDRVRWKMQSAFRRPARYTRPGATRRR